MDYQYLEIKHPDEIIRVMINRPEKRNAFNEQLIQELTHFFKNLYSGSKARVVILSGKGPSFCAGADLGYMQQIASFGAEENYHDALRLAHLFETIDKCPIPCMAYVHGHVFGGANGLIAACDIVIAEVPTLFVFSEVKLGIAPATIAPYVMSKIGFSKARDLMLSGRKFDAQEAKECGLVHFAAQPDEARRKLESYANEFLAAGPKALMATKKLLHELNSSVIYPHEKTAQLIAELRQSIEGQEGLLGYLEKRKASWVKHIKEGDF